MKTAVAAPDFEAHEELRLLLWALLQKRIIRLQIRNELMTEFAGQDLKMIVDLLHDAISNTNPHAGDLIQ